jgi:UDP-GlcNAc:undecaprenyl-phosphate GlcNAc-1-phosphate transferase
MNTIQIEPFILAAAAAITVAFAYCASLFASQSRRFLDHPNDRSSHALATPRIGGLAIIGAWLVGLFVIGAFSSNVDLARSAALMAALAAAALGIGLIDDRAGLSPAWKFLGQVIVAAAFTGLFGPFLTFPVPYFGDVALPLLWGVVVTILWIVGFMNAFNFMDGSNGLAAGTAAVGLAWISVIAGGAGASLLFASAFLLALAATGFLPQNLKRGKLFMGDNGSQSLGFLIAAFGVLGVNWTGGRMTALIVPVIFAPLIFDVIWTLVCRLIRGSNIFEAHREHLYQLMIRSGASHAAVAVFYMGMVSLSAGAAVLLLTLPYSLQWLVPALMAAAFSVGATLIHRHAISDGHFSKEPRTVSRAEREMHDASLHAAE